MPTDAELIADYVRTRGVTLCPPVGHPDLAIRNDARDALALSVAQARGRKFAAKAVETREASRTQRTSVRDASINEDGEAGMTVDALVRKYDLSPNRIVQILRAGARR